jgi:hypothetical protein
MPIRQSLTKITASSARDRTQESSNASVSGKITISSDGGSSTDDRVHVWAHCSEQTNYLVTLWAFTLNWKTHLNQSDQYRDGFNQTAMKSLTTLPLSFFTTLHRQKHDAYLGSYSSLYQWLDFHPNSNRIYVCVPWDTWARMVLLRVNRSKVEID